MKKIFVGVQAHGNELSVQINRSSRLIGWSVGDGGNGHFYEVVLAPSGGINCVDAQADAVSRGGYLVTLTTEEESDFVFDNLVDASVVWEFDSFAVGPWIGGFQPESSTEPIAEWQWLNGDVTLASTYENWRSGEPNNFSGEEDHLLFFDFEYCD